MTGGPSARRPVVLATLAVAAIALVLVVVFVPLGRTEPERVVVGGSPLFEKPAPEIDLPTLEGGRMRLSDLRGRPVIVNFWATWCGPCKEEFPLMVAAYERHQAEGLEIIGVVHDDTAEGARRFAADYGATWPMLDDAQDVAWRDYGGVGVPQSYFIDPDGVVRAFSLGPFTRTGLSAQLATILPDGAATSPSASPEED